MEKAAERKTSADQVYNIIWRNFSLSLGLEKVYCVEDILSCTKLVLNVSFEIS